MDQIKFPHILRADLRRLRNAGGREHQESLQLVYDSNSTQYMTAPLYGICVNSVVPNLKAQARALLWSK